MPSMQNVEYKAELRDLELARVVCRKIGARAVASFRQTDTYYRVADGRLKKREAPGEPTEWIFYHRQSRVKPKLSNFTIYSDREAKERYGERPLPVWLIVEKNRELWMWGSVRVHLDEVFGLGRFVEIEALVTPRHHLGKCHRLVAKLIEKLGPAMGEAISNGYAEMMALEQEVGPTKQGA